MGDPAFDLANTPSTTGSTRRAPALLPPTALRTGKPTSSCGSCPTSRGDVGRRPATLSELDFDFVAYAAEHFSRHGGHSGRTTLQNGV